MAGILQSLAGTLAKGVPGAPTIGTATDVGTSRAYDDGAATVTFSTGAGPTPTIYYLTSTPSISVWYGYSSPLTASGLASGTSYTFTVEAANDAGIGPASGASNSITATTTPYYVGISGYAATVVFQVLVIQHLLFHLLVPQLVVNSLLLINTLQMVGQIGLLLRAPLLLKVMVLHLLREVHQQDLLEQ